MLINREMFLNSHTWIIKFPQIDISTKTYDEVGDNATLWLKIQAFAQIPDSQPSTQVSLQQFFTSLKLTFLNSKMWIIIVSIF